MLDLIKLDQWKKLTALCTKLQKSAGHDYFNLCLVQKFAQEVAGLHIDYTYNHIDQNIMQALLDLARARQVDESISHLFAGQIVNITEQRAAMHMAWRNLSGLSMSVGGHNIMPAVGKVWQKMWDFADNVAQQKLLGCTGKPITDIVNIGIGGSDLGPKLLYQALRPYKNSQIHCRFIANFDRAELYETLEDLDPERVIFIVTSKSFTTRETQVNAQRAMQWLQETLGTETWQQQVYAVTANAELAKQQGFLSENIFRLWGWLGGRYSVWSPVAISVIASIGVKNFREFLAGAHAIDLHFLNSELCNNVPVIMALLSIWNINFLHLSTRAIIPYNYHLRSLPEYLQQLHMESLGKSVTSSGKDIDYSTGAIIWGGLGSKSQHSFHQLFFQGKQIIPCDFITTENQDRQDADEQEIFINCLSQREVFAKGYSYKQALHDLLADGMPMPEAKQLASHKMIRGGHPSNLIILPKLSPYYLGALLALYEHKVYVQSAIWEINAFDQWGVERGKCVSKHIGSKILHSQATDNVQHLFNKHYASYYE